MVTFIAGEATEVLQGQCMFPSHFIRSVVSVHKLLHLSQTELLQYKTTGWKLRYSQQFEVANIQIFQLNIQWGWSADSLLLDQPSHSPSPTRRHLSVWCDSEDLPDCLRVWWLYIWNREGAGNRRNLRALLPLSSSTTTPRGMSSAPSSLLNTISWVTLPLSPPAFFTTETFIKSHNLFSIQRVFSSLRETCLKQEHIYSKLQIILTNKWTVKWPETNNKNCL